MFQVYVSDKGRKYLASLPEKMRRRIMEALSALRDNPIPAQYYDLKKLSDFGGAYRIRISSFRILYSVDWTRKEINVAKIGRRDETTYG